MPAVGDKVRALFGSRRPAIAYGVESITISTAGSSGSADVTFPFTFTSPPIVETTPLTTAPNQNPTSASNVTTTGCKIWLYRASTGTVPVQWTATGPDGL